jgi:hypothetical protein
VLLHTLNHDYSFYGSQKQYGVKHIKRRFKCALTDSSIGRVKVSYLWSQNTQRSRSLDPNNVKTDVMYLMACIRVFLAAAPPCQRSSGFIRTSDIMFSDFSLPAAVNLRLLFFQDVTQPRLVTPFWDSLENRAYRLSRNVGNQLPTHAA